MQYCPYTGPSSSCHLIFSLSGNVPSGVAEPTEHTIALYGSYFPFSFALYIVTQFCCLFMRILYVDAACVSEFIKIIPKPTASTIYNANLNCFILLYIIDLPLFPQAGLTYRNTEILRVQSASITDSYYNNMLKMCQAGHISNVFLSYS